MFAFTEGNYETSNDILSDFVGIQEEIIQHLNLPYRILDMASEELGAAAYRKFDIEVWMPSK